MMDTDTRSLPYVSVALAASSWGMWPVILSHGRMPAHLQAALALAIPTLVAGALCLYQRVPCHATQRQWLALAGYGIGDALGLILFFSALRFTTVAIAVLTHYLSTFLIPLSVIVLKVEKPNARTFAAVFMALAGLALLFSPWNNSLHFNDLIGALLGAASAVFSTINILIVKRLARSFSGLELIFLHGLFALPALAGPLLWTHLATVSTQSILIVSLGALGPGTIGVLLFYRGLRGIPASHAAVLTLLEPFVAVLSAALLMSQLPDIPTIVGGLAILTAAAIVFAPRNVPRMDHPYSQPVGSTIVAVRQRACNCRSMDQRSDIKYPGGWECPFHGFVRKGSAPIALCEAPEDYGELQHIPGEPEYAMSAREMSEAEFRRPKDFFSLAKGESVEF